MKLELYTHQKLTSEFLQRTPRGFITSDPGTGKTSSCLDAVLAAIEEDPETRVLVLAPLSILEPAWGGDIRKFTDLSYRIAHGTPKKREEAMRSASRIVITNHDAVNWIAKDPTLYSGFTHLIIDEFTAYKNRATQRSKALQKIAYKIPHLWMLSGTPTSNSVTDIWFPGLLVDQGQRLGPNFFRFREQVQSPIQTGPDPMHRKWEDKAGAQEAVADRLKDITIRFRFEDCVDIPPNVHHTIELEMPAWLRKKYVEFEKTDWLVTENGTVNTVHASARVRKLLQMLSGAVYDTDGKPIKVHNERYELVLGLIEEREQCVVAFNWKHELEALKAEADKRGLSYGVINGDTPSRERVRIVDEFQAGRLRIVFAHPQSAGHGLTLTRGTTTIWCSPTYNGEHFEQFNARIYRTGQTRKTETIRIAYSDSKEIEVYSALDKKLTGMNDLLDLFQQLSTQAA